MTKLWKTLKNFENFANPFFLFFFFFEINNAKNFLNNAVNKGQKWLYGCKWDRWLCKCRKKGGKVAGFRRRNKGKNYSRTAGMGRTRAVGPRIWRQQARSNRGFKGNRRGLGRKIRADSGGRSATVLWTGAVGSRLWAEKTRSGRGCGGKKCGFWRPKTTAKSTVRKK